MKLYLIKLWPSVIGRLNYLPILSHTHKVRNIIKECVEEYLLRENISYQTIELTIIKQGMNYRALDGGSFLVKISMTNGKTLNLFAKRNSFLGRRNLLKNPFTVRDYSHRPDHNIHFHSFIFQNGISVVKPQYINAVARVIITKQAEGVPLKKALALNPDKTINLLIKVGENLGKLHKLNIVFKILKPEHIIVNLKNNKITLIDYDRLLSTSSINKFIKDFHYLYCRLYYNFPKKIAYAMQKNLLKGYKNVIQNNYPSLPIIIEWEMINSNKYCFIRKILHQLDKFIDQKIVNKISFGYFRMKWKT